MRVLLPLLGLVLIGFCVESTVVEYASARTRASPIPCGVFVDQPMEEWVTLAGCNLDFEDAVLSDGAELYERYSDRRQGLSHSLKVDEPTWKVIYAPMSNRYPKQGEPGHAVRAVAAITDRDALAYVNAVERAKTQRDRDRLLEKSRELDRLVAVPQLVGHGEKCPEAERVQRVLGSLSAPTLVVLKPGSVPEPAVSGLAFFSGAFGLFMMLMGVRQINRRAQSAVDEVQVVNTSDVRVEVGELAALREEERLARLQQKRK